MSLERRITRLEQADERHIYRLAEEAGRQVGVCAEAILTEARRIFALPDAEQRATLHRLYAELDDAAARELDVIRHRHAAILRRTR